MNIGVLSGTFDPIHNGHIELATKMAQENELDGVVFIVEDSPRSKQPLASYEDRKTMVELALQEHPHFHHFTARQKNHSLETINDLLQLERDPINIHLIVGRDVATQMPRWDDWQKIVTNFGVIVADREQSDEPLPHATVHDFSHPARSKSIRTQISNNQDGEHLNPTVKDYITVKKLYR